MDPSKSPLNQSQQDRLSSILNTNTAQAGEPQSPFPAPNQPSNPTPDSLSSNQNPESTMTPSSQPSSHPDTFGQFQENPQPNAQPPDTLSQSAASQQAPQPQPPTDGSLATSQAFGQPTSLNSLGSTNTPATPSQPETTQSQLGQIPQPPGQTPSPQPATYQAPVIGIPQTEGGLQSPTPQTTGAELKPSKNKPVKVKSGFPSTILYVVGGVILLVVYTLIWAVVFDLELPFGITLPL